MNVTLDFSSTFREEQEATGADECSEAVASSDVDASYPQIDADNTLSWVVDQLGLCNIPVSEDIIEQSNMLAPLAALLEEKCKVAAQNKKLMDDYSRVRTKLNAHIRDKQTHNEQLDAMRQEVRAAQGRVGALQQEQRESRNRWVEEKADLESKVFQMLAVQTQVQGSLRKKEKDHEKLQNQLAKAVREGNKSNKTMISISKPIKQNAHQLSTAERAEASATALRAAEVASLRQYVHQLEVSVSVTVPPPCLLPCRILL
jgi:chromosome segregation ATPase